MTEPKDVQLARMTIDALRCSSNIGSDAAVAAFSAAKSIVDAHEANIEASRKQAEEHQRAIEETARRWPHLEGWRYVESEYNLSFHHPERTNVYIDKADGALSSYSNGEERQTDSAVVLALIDAAGRNTTADRFREAITRAVNVLYGATECEDAASVLDCANSALAILEASNG